MPKGKRQKKRKKMKNKYPWEMPKKFTRNTQIGVLKDIRELLLELVDLKIIENNPTLKFYNKEVVMPKGKRRRRRCLKTFRIGEKHEDTQKA